MVFSRTNINAVTIVGWVLAVVVILVLIGVLAWCFLERRRKRRTSTLVPFLGPEVPPMPQFLPSSPQRISTAVTTQVPSHPIPSTLRCGESRNLQNSTVWSKFQPTTVSLWKRGHPPLICDGAKLVQGYLTGTNHSFPVQFPHCPSEPAGNVQS